MIEVLLSKSRELSSAVPLGTFHTFTSSDVWIEADSCWHNEAEIL